jgi:hypothetical protein
VRLTRLAVAGWRVIHVTSSQLDNPAELLRHIEKILGPQRVRRGRRSQASLRASAPPAVPIRSPTVMSRKKP